MVISMQPFILTDVCAWYGWKRVASEMEMAFYVSLNDASPECEAQKGCVCAWRPEKLCGSVDQQRGFVSGEWG